MSEREGRVGATETGQRSWLLLLLSLLVLGCALYFPGLGASDLWDPWEPKYAQTAREMAERDSWLIPFYREDERLNKVPVTYWLIAMSHAVVGVTELGARLPSAILAILSAMALGAALARRGLPFEGFLAGAALLTSPQWLLLGRFATPDIPLAFFLTLLLSLALILPTARTPGSRRMMLIGVVLALAGAGMTDWPRGLLLPAWAVVAWAAFRWNWRGPLGLLVVAVLYSWGQATYSWQLNFAAAGLAILLAAVVLNRLAGISIPALAVGAVIVVALVAPWFLMAWKVAPDEMSIVTRYKYLFNLGESLKMHRGDWHTVVRTFAVGGMPWTALAAVGLFGAFPPRSNRLAVSFAGALAGVTLFYALAEAKMSHFYGAMLPALAGLAALGAMTVVRRLQWKSLTSVGVLLLLWMVVWRDPSRILGTATVKTNLYDVELSFAIIGMLLAFLLVVAAAVAAQRPAWVAAAVLPAALFAGMLGQRVVPALEEKKSLGPLWKAYVERREGQEPIAFLGPSKDSIFYYSNNAVHRLKEKQPAHEFLKQPGVKFMITLGKSFPYFVSAHPGRWTQVQMAHPVYKLMRYDPDSPPGFDTQDLRKSNPSK